MALWPGLALALGLWRQYARGWVQGLTRSRLRGVLAAMAVRSPNPRTYSSPTSFALTDISLPLKLLVA